MSLNKEYSKSQLTSLSLGAIGVVFGDIGTSPLYAMKEVFHGGLTLDRLHVLGVLSLIFWSLTLVVTIKYAIFIMRADNKGEGGIMALMVLTLRGLDDNTVFRRFIVVIGLSGTALFYGDSIITPAISVLSAAEGLQVISPNMEHYVLPITISVLGVLFIAQAKGTGDIGKIFAPVMCVWFIALAGLGINNVLMEPSVLEAINPYYGVHLLYSLGWRGFLIMGAVVLAITGAEALYADMGHFGLKPIRYAWFGFVFPALLCNYFGQGALLLRNPEAIQNPFYWLAPQWALYPLVVLATVATVIASQAVISGAFSLTRQAIQLGYCPRMDIVHTSGYEKGQVYVPTINWLLMVAVFILVLSFGSSSDLASAYGIAVTGTMMVTTLLAFIVIRNLWQWRVFTSIVFLVIFLSIDFVFLSSNSLKIFSGGWLPLIVGVALFFIMTTWLADRNLLAEYQDSKRMMFEELGSKLKDNPLVTVKGTAIYLARSLHGVPQVLQHNLEHNHVLHEQVVVMTIVTTDEPYVEESKRIKIRQYGDTQQFYRVKLYYGFQQSADVRYALMCLKQEGLAINLKNVSFFVGIEKISFKAKSSMPFYRRFLFNFMFHNAASPIEFFKIPVEHVIEIGIRCEL